MKKLLLKLLLLAAGLSAYSQISSENDISLDRALKIYEEGKEEEARKIAEFNRCIFLLY